MRIVSFCVDRTPKTRDLVVGLQLMTKINIMHALLARQLQYYIITTSTARFDIDFFFLLPWI